MIKLIVAYDQNKLIGNNDHLPWNIPEDLNHFKKETLNKTILFGEVTFNGIGRPLPNRKTIVLTLNKDFKFQHQNVEICNDFNEIVKTYKNNKNQDVIIAGGATIYKLFLPYVDEMIISKIKKTYKGNVYFPNWNENEFKLVKSIDKKDFIINWYTRI
ncbi:MAG: dihydrofolate reductase [Candidatus Tyloplasma litorale]|nr:MAG: dihydrofolate reductase [Mycoplasmatales bacterium]